MNRDYSGHQIAVVIEEQVTIGAITEGTGADYRRDMLNLRGLRRL